MPFILKQFDETWAYDLNKNSQKGRELFDEEVLDQSIEVILGTMLGERLFNRSFGTGLFLYLFENINENLGEKILDDILNSIKRWEDRIIVDTNNVKLDIFPDENAITITIPYKIIRTGQRNVFKKKIYQ